jgi:hypothetical protein
MNGESISIASAPGSATPAFNPVFSIADNAVAQPTRTATAMQLVDLFRTGEHRPLVAKIRTIYVRVLADTGDPKAAKNAVAADKKNLPGIMPSGIFRARGDKNLETYSHVLCADVDGLAAERVGIVYDQLAGDPHCCTVSVSPTGSGVKALCRTTGDAEQHGQSVAAMAKYLFEAHGLEIDPSCKNLERLCFAPDNASEWNENAIPFDPLPLEVKTPVTRPPALPPSAHPSNRNAVAERLLGAIQWEDEITGFCKCPGEHLHTSANSAKDCKVMLDGVPTVSCFHGSCAGIVAGVNHELRSQIGKFEFVKPTAPSSKRADVASEYLPGTTEDAQPAATPGRLTLRKPDEILAMIFDDSDIYLANRLLADGQPLVIAAQGGAGKSRLALQLVAAIISGREFIGFQTGKPKSRWLFLQTENSNRRLKFDLEHIQRWLGDADWQKFNEQVVIHTLENDTDGFVNLDSLENQIAIMAAIKAATPDGIVIDPLNEFSIGDLNKDVDMRATLQALSRICKKGNPQRVIVPLHHALTGRGGAAKVTGHDRASFARNSKVMHAWTRGQINIAPIDPDDNSRLIVACGKCSNGKEFEKFAIKLNPETFIYERDNSIDLSQWEEEMTGAKKKRTASPEQVRELAYDKPTKAELVKRIRAEVGCGHSAAYEAVEIAERRKTIHYSKALKTYDQSA